MAEMAFTVNYAIMLHILLLTSLVVYKLSTLLDLRAPTLTQTKTNQECAS